MWPLLPSVYETSPNTFRKYEVAALPYVLYKSCRYSVPRSYAFKTVQYKVVGGKIHIYDEDRNFICTHNLSERKGSGTILPHIFRRTSGPWRNSIRRSWNQASQQGSFPP